MEKVNFNRDWVYYLDGKAEQKNLVHLPHDAMLHRERIPGLKNGSYVGYFPSGDYWYEKRFLAPQDWAEKSVILEFEGIYMDSTVYLNGDKIGGRVYGYSGFAIDISEKIKIGQENFLQVFAHCSQVPNSRWYPGNGIYRPVNLYVGDKSHIVPEELTVKTISIDPPTILVEGVHTGNVDDCVCIRVFQDDRELGIANISTENTTSGFRFHTLIALPEAKLWDAEHPNLCAVECSLMREGNTIDTLTEQTGIRQLSWNDKDGLMVNGKTVKLRGGCVHHDNGLLGACEFQTAAERRVRILKESGFNAIRSSHYPISKALLEECDKQGLYIMDEAFDSWVEATGLYGYVLSFEEEWEKDLSAMVIKDRNHPSVLMYSIGNEIPDTATAEGVVWTERMTKLCHQLDDTRPVTVCPNVLMNMLAQKGLHFSISGSNVPKKEDITDLLERDKDSSAGGSVMINMLVSVAPTLMQLMLKPKGAEKGVKDCFSKVDIAGYNYGHKVYEGHHALSPERIIVGSETRPGEIAQNWALVEKNPYVIGDFMWTAWDYLGEVGIGALEYGKNGGAYTKPYPYISAYSGAIGLTGMREPYSYLAAAVWKQSVKPYIGVHPLNHNGEKLQTSMYKLTDIVDSWSWPGYVGSKARIVIYSMGESCSLYLNQKKIGSQKLKYYTAAFETTYEPGELMAISYDRDGNEIGRNILCSAGEDTILTAEAEKTHLRADGEDLAYINVTVTDGDGIRKMLSDCDVVVSVEGAGTLQAVGSACPKPEDSYVGDHFRTYEGRMQIIVRAGFEPGDIRVNISSQLLGSKKEIVLRVDAN